MSGAGDVHVPQEPVLALRGRHGRSAGLECSRAGPAALAHATARSGCRVAHGARVGSRQRRGHALQAHQVSEYNYA